METTLTCNYSSCDFPAVTACNCESNSTLLCQEHAFQHVEDLPDKVHALQQLYLPLQFNEQEAFLSAQTFLLNTEKAHKEEMVNENSLKSGKILKELEKTTNRLQRQLNDTNQTHLKELNYLTMNMSEMKTALTEIGTLGIPTFRRDRFSIRLEALKKDNQVFTYPDILKEIKTYWEQQGMGPLGHLIPTQGQSSTQSTHITDQLQLTQIRKHRITTGGISNISFSSDGRYYAAGSKDKTIKIWDAKSGELLHSLSGHSDRVLSVSFSPDGEFLTSGSADNTIRLWKLSIGQVIKGHSDWVCSVVFSNNGEFIASGSLDKTVKLWKVKGELLHSFQGHSNQVFSVCFSHDDRLFASGNYKTIKIWNVSSGELKITLSSHSNTVYSVCFARTNSLFVSGSMDCTVKLWNVQSGELVHTLQGHTSGVYSVVFSPDDQVIASGGEDATIKLWRVATGSLITTLNQHSSWVVGIKFSPDGLILASRDVSELKLFSLL